MDKLTEAQQDWDDFAADYYAGEQASQVPYVSAVITYLQQQDLLPHQQQSLLDLGGGTGRFAVPLVRLGVKVAVADFSAAMLAILQQRRLELAQPELLTFQQTSWQALVKSGRKYPVVFMSMLPDVAPSDLAKIAQLATERFLIFRLVSVEDDFFTPLLNELALPPERPEANRALMAAYQQQNLPDFAPWLAHDFNFATTEVLSTAEANDYLTTYPEMTAEKMALAHQRLQAALVKQKLTVTERYCFRLLTTQRILKE
ncbi:class I SAM-dependent methyltransferase [Lapidilactobacillus wuchangensis]|uniref:class I SAM-dependent methyltransferase n=1 Tax=Lapidilactobacillus wuchangensis TaxID=2486001 RepID=UPI0013DE6883|nr:methyltransferase domain-containing protein [Lapidilactobacillus wuchangensis]